MDSAKIKQYMEVTKDIRHKLETEFLLDLTPIFIYLILGFLIQKVQWYDCIEEVIFFTFITSTKGILSKEGKSDNKIFNTFVIFMIASLAIYILLILKTDDVRMNFIVICGIIMLITSIVLSMLLHCKIAVKEFNKRKKKLKKGNFKKVETVKEKSIKEGGKGDD